MTANLLAHTDLFRAGVATSGSYNKTLTPFGFQNERRSVWKAQDVYLKVSPFFFADKMQAPLLIMHGDDDANPGTTPLQAEQALRGDPRQRRHRAAGDAAARAALVLGDGVERAARLRGAALVRQVREERGAAEARVTLNRGRLASGSCLRQCIGDFVEGEHVLGGAAEDGFARHSEDDARRFVLGDASWRRPARISSEPFGAVVAHAGEDHADWRSRPAAAATERKSTSTLGRWRETSASVGQLHVEAVAVARDEHVAVAGSDQGAVR